MYALEVREHVMIAHSLPGPAFGPAQRLHGATFVVDATFFARNLGPNDVVVDIGAATEALRRVLEPLAYRNLDDLPDFHDRRSTTEALCRWVFDALRAELAADRLGEDGRSVSRLRVTLTESHLAKGWYEADL
ncbi:6-pyruvoyl trahydropterin synthase family protein [Acuticoccus sp.]|uniref:6-pyruvoyl trahydropterin synthase family protein n=1 Tax=Acuticoccus sp. TaxID=1904378 RepID=UPI003B519E9F